MATNVSSVPALYEPVVRRAAAELSTLLGFPDAQSALDITKCVLMLCVVARAFIRHPLRCAFISTTILFTQFRADNDDG